MRYMTPMETGNLRYNAVGGGIMSGGFYINVDFTKAVYGYFQNQEGFTHEGWIDFAFETIEADIHGRNDGSNFQESYKQRLQRVRAREYDKLTERDRRYIRNRNRARRLWG